MTGNRQLPPSDCCPNNMKQKKRSQREEESSYYFCKIKLAVNLEDYLESSSRSARLSSYPVCFTYPTLVLLPSAYLGWLANYHYNAISTIPFMSLSRLNNKESFPGKQSHVSFAKNSLVPNLPHHVSMLSLQYSSLFPWSTQKKKLSAYSYLPTAHRMMY